MFEYVVITYINENIDKDNCFRFVSDYDDCDINPYNDYVPVTIGSNQSIFKIEDSPTNCKEIEYI